MAWHKPLSKTFKLVQSDQEAQALSAQEVGIPLGSHPGSFAFVRKHHIHEGVDLYCRIGTPVLAVEAGVVVAVEPFTGPIAGSPWWLPTKCVMVEGLTGVVVYGEIDPLQAIESGMRVKRGAQLGTVVRVIKRDKGRPLSMLHLELHYQGARSAPEWTSITGRPTTLRDPTPYLFGMMLNQK